LIFVTVRSFVRRNALPRFSFVDLPFVEQQKRTITTT
jgi:hypothetical protein